MAKQIPLTQGKFALVDDNDYERLSQYKWYFSNFGYARRNGKMTKRIKAPSMLMHREIMSVQGAMQVDHINGNKLDNRKENLRVCTNAENTRNQKKKAGSSKYKGVRWYARDGVWHASIKVMYRSIHLGYFKNEEDAATAYNLAAVMHHGDFARLNLSEA